MTDLEYLNSVPHPRKSNFSIDGKCYYIREDYKEAVFKHNPNYTVEEIMGTYLGHNPDFDSFETWHEKNGCTNFYSYDDSSLGDERGCWNCGQALSNHS